MCPLAQIIHSFSFFNVSGYTIARFSPHLDARVNTKNKIKKNFPSSSRKAKAKKNDGRCFAVTFLWCFSYLIIIIFNAYFVSNVCKTFFSCAPKAEDTIKNSKVSQSIFERYSFTVGKKYSKEIFLMKNNNNNNLMQSFEIAHGNDCCKGSLKQVKTGTKTEMKLFQLNAKTLKTFEWLKQRCGTWENF